MGSLVFLREKLGAVVLVTGVKRPDDELFYRILGDDQQITHHPVCIQHKLLSGRGRRTAAVKLSESEYKVYFDQGRFSFRGVQLQTGKCRS